MVIVNKMEGKDIKKRTGIKMVIILSALLAVSIVGLAGTLIYQSMKDSEPVAVTVPDNIISPDAEDGPSEKKSTDKKADNPRRSAVQISPPETPKANCLHTKRLYLPIQAYSPPLPKAQRKQL